MNEEDFLAQHRTHGVLCVNCGDAIDPEALDILRQNHGMNETGHIGICNCFDPVMICDQDGVGEFEGTVPKENLGHLHQFRGSKRNETMNEGIGEYREANVFSLAWYREAVRRIKQSMDDEEGIYVLMEYISDVISIGVELLRQEEALRIREARGEEPYDLGEPDIEEYRESYKKVEKELEESERSEGAKDLNTADNETRDDQY